VSDNTTYLKGDGSQGYVKSITIASGKQENSITSNIRHYGKNTPSDILARAVVKDSSTSILNSITKIEKGARRADGQQTGRVLMMNEKSRGDANPILLIDENDVTAGHAASAGKVDPLQIYYLMSRGMTKADAERLIIYGFLNPLLEEIPIEDVVKQLKRVIERKLR
jgi:Fe-S cluster assembly protein SufD